MIRTAIFSGSFNPIHIGHLALANWLCEFENPDELWFMITPQNPLKKQKELMPDQLRLELVQQSIGDYPKFRACDFEFTLSRPSYTIDTLQALRLAYPDREFIFIMGADNWASIERWKDYKILLDEFPVLVYPRLGYEVYIPDACRSVRLVQAPVIEISSTFIRESYRAGKDIRFFLPEAIRYRKLEFPAR